jgi:hypothetical protein
MARLAILIAAQLLAVMPSGASNAVSLGYSDETTVVGPGTDACASGALIYNHDGSFENGYAWEYEGCQPPYYGAFGEAYDLGAGTATCGAFWLTSLPGFGVYDPADCYLWEGGVADEPGAVLAVVTGVAFSGMGTWPYVNQHDVDMNVGVDGAFTVGYWANMQGGFDFFFCGADENGPRGHPWTCIAPDQGYPSGWQDPAIVGGWWGPTKSMGLGVYFEQATPIRNQTWGAVKAMFR